MRGGALGHTLGVYSKIHVNIFRHDSGNFNGGYIVRFTAFVEDILYLTCVKTETRGK